MKDACLLALILNIYQVSGIFCWWWFYLIDTFCSLLNGVLCLLGLGDYLE